MLSKNLNRVCALATFAVLLGSTLIAPAWSMEPETNEISTHTRAQSFFKYDLNHLEDARKVIAQADFLSEEARSFFEQSVKTYDRTQFLKYLDLDKKNKLLEDIELPDQYKNTPSEEMLAQLAEAGVFLPEETLECLRAEDRKNTQKWRKKMYDPYLNNIEHNILEKGPFNCALFDAFIHHLWQSWEADEQENYSIKESPYSQEAVYSLLLNLEKVGFLKDFKMESLSNWEEAYGPLEQLRFFKNNRAEPVLDLAIAGGHIGHQKIESISRYKNCLMIDIIPFQVPDIIADINDTKLLTVLLENYESHFNAIYDTFNTFTFGSGYKPETVDAFVSMLKPGGRLMIASSAASEDPNDYDMNQDDYHKALIKKYDLIPIYSNKNPDRMIALEKK